jgi:hypothetical protein
LQDQISNTSTQQKELQLGVKRAQLTEQEARVRRRRAIQDDRKAQAQGIEGSPEVIAARQRIVDANRQYRQAIQGVADAQHGLRDAEHGVLLAHRQIHDATIAVAQATAQMGAQQRKAAQDFKALSPGQREFVLAIEDFKKKWKEAMQPVTDIIAGGIARALKRVSILLQDPEIHSALMSLAREIAGVADGFSKWIISPAGRRDILFFIRESVRNLPIIARAAGHFALALVNIAKAAAPLFRSIVDGFDRTGKKADHFTRNTSRLDRFFASAGRNLHAWVALAGAVGNLLAALIGVSAGTGLKMVNGMADAFNNLADRVRKNPEPVRKFFEQVRTSLAEILPLIGHLLLGLIRLFNSPAFGEFVKFMLQQMIPAIIDVMKVFSTFIKILNDFTRIPIIGPIIGYVIHLGILYFALIKLFPVLKTLTGLIGAMGKKTIIGIAIVAIYELYTHLGFLQKKFGALGEAIRVIASLMGGLLVIRMLKAYSSLGQLGSRVLVVAGDIAKTLVNAIKSLIIKEGEADAASGAGGLGGALGKLRGVIGGAGGGRGLASMIGKAGLAAAVGVLAFEATKAILHITGLDKKLAAFGAHAFDFISRSKTGQKIAGFLTGTDLSKVDRANQLDEIDAKYGAGNVSAAVLEYGRLRHKKGWTDTRALLRAARDHHIDPHDLATAMAPSIRPPGYEKGGTVAGSRQGAPVNAVVHVGEWILNKAQQLRLSALLGTPLNYIKNFLFGGTDTGKLPLFSAEGPQFYAAAFKHNRPFAKPGPYTTHLSDHEEAAFRRWVSRNSVPFDPNARLSDYDMRGFFKAMLRGAVPQWRRGSHFPDTWKTPYDTSFSHESKYATVDNPFYWVGNKLIDKRTGQTVFGDPARFADGGVVGSETATGKAINIIAHAGEWVLNKAQQMNLARKLGTTVEQAKAQIFGTSGIGPHNMPDGTSAKPSQGGSSYKNFDLVPYTDDYGIQLWFLKMSNGVWAQVTARDAKHIQQTKGSWLPTYINRRTRIPSISPSRGLGIARAFSGGGVVSFSMPGVRGYANGGVVGGPQINAPAGKRGGIDHFEQHFNVKTEGESDWHHIFRLGAQHVQAAY